MKLVALFGVPQHKLDLFAAHAWKPSQKIIDPRAPSSRFSNSAFTGTRVPLNSHTPPTFPGTRSTAGHWLQSSMTQSYVERNLPASAVP
jgi:hypothetical protein